jgi:hypothetical protein
VVWYIDTSAFLELIAAEREKTQMQAWLASHIVVANDNRMLDAAAELSITAVSL